MGHGEHDHDLNALAEKAKVIAEATDRCEEDVLADLLDDGKANLTAGADAIEKDFLDKAQEQAEKFKALLTTLIPIIVLLGAIGAEGIGLLDLTDWGGDSIFDEEGGVLWGCMDDAALNYNEGVNEDDESCEYDHEDHEGETCGDVHPDQDHEEWLVEEEEPIEGCMDDEANNFNENATETDDSCEYDPEIIEGCTNSTATNYNENATVDDDSCEYPPPRCEIVLYEILLTYNNTSAVVQYDLDCGTGENDQDGYNVSVQFWNSENNTSLNYTIGYHYIKGYVADIQELYLENLTAGMYDFHWIAIWTDDDGEQGLLEVNWSDIEIAGEAE
jgi:hypothetical protein